MPPLYEYICKDCAHRFEEVVKGTGSNIIECPHCETMTAEKLFPVHAGYKIKGDNSASVTPKGSGAFKGSK